MRLFKSNAHNDCFYGECSQLFFTQQCTLSVTQFPTRKRKMADTDEQTMRQASSTYFTHKREIFI